MPPLSAGRVLAAVLVVTGLLYAPLLAAGLAYDDALLLPALAERPWEGVFARSLWPADVVAVNGLSYWRPLQEIEFKLLLELFGLAPGALHAPSVVLHLLVGAALFALLARRLRETPGAPLLAGAIAAAFLLHPAHQEAVALVAARNDLWAALAVLGAALAWRTRAWALAPVLVAVGMGFKEVAAVAIPLLLGLDLAEGRLDKARAAALVAVAPCYLLVRLGIAGQPLGVSGGVTAGSLAGWPVHAAALLAGARPAQVHQPLSLLWGDPAWWAPGVVTGIVAAALLARTPVGRVGVAAFLVAGTLALPAAVATDNFGDRYLYVADLGLAIACAELVRGRVVSRRAWFGVAGVLALGAALNAATLPRWSSDEALWSAAAATDRTGFSAHQLALARLRDGDRPGALVAYRMALAAELPDTSVLAPMGVLLVATGDRPGGCAAIGEAEARAERLDARALAAWAFCARAAGDLPSAIARADAALAADPRSVAGLLEAFAAARLSADPTREARAREGLAAAGVSEAMALDRLAAMR